MARALASLYSAFAVSNLLFVALSSIVLRLSRFSGVRFFEDLSIVLASLYSAFAVSNLLFVALSSIVPEALQVLGRQVF